MPALFRRYAGALAHRDFRLLVAAFVIDSIGSWAASVVLSAGVFIFKPLEGQCAA